MSKEIKKILISIILISIFRQVICIKKGLANDQGYECKNVSLENVDEHNLIKGTDAKVEDREGKIKKKDKILTIFLYIFKSIKKESEFLVALGTIFLAIATFYSVHQYNKKDRKVRNRETLEKIIKPILKDLIVINNCLESIQIPSFFKKGYGQYFGKYSTLEKIKRDNFYLLSNLKTKTIKNIDNFFLTLEVIIYLYNQHHGKIANIIEKFINSKLPEISWSVPPEERIYYQATIGGKPIGTQGSSGVYILNLIFKDQNLKDYISDFMKKSNILEKNIENEKVIVNGHVVKERKNAKSLEIHDFEDIVFSIKQAILKEPNLTKFLESSKETYKQSKDLLENLNREMNRLSKRS